ncbi:hypothetical protein BRYFOR_08759 [Marvinbryantia formatexigens DSM 14469]|uniref:Uncharacterized protein n=1 Tax=Marvinbryantia formatexigens DSM 14469 TaxID=478749 RepID=C6LJC3_9FIRM|nr:hypothetical protein BRYFOR_08759 [Marvinbryantia formatexigens DSM 14469]
MPAFPEIPHAISPHHAAAFYARVSGNSHAISPHHADVFYARVSGNSHAISPHHAAAFLCPYLRRHPVKSAGTSDMTRTSGIC